MSTARPPKQKAPALAYTPPATLAAEYLAMTDTVGIGRMAVCRPMSTAHGMRSRWTRSGSSPCIVSARSQ